MDREGGLRGAIPASVTLCDRRGPILRARGGETVAPQAFPLLVDEVALSLRPDQFFPGWRPSSSTVRAESRKRGTKQLAAGGPSQCFQCPT